MAKCSEGSWQTVCMQGKGCFNFIFWLAVWHASLKRFASRASMD